MQAFWELIISNALIATILAIATALLSRVWKNPAAIHLMWVVVLLKLFTPPILSTGIPLPTQWRSAASISNQSVEQPRRSANSTSQYDVLTDVTKNSTDTLDRDDANRDLRADPLAIPWMPSSPRDWPLSSILLGIWLAGSLGIALRQALSIRRFAMLLRGTVPPAEAITAKARQLGDHLGLSRIPNIGMSPAALPPLVWSVGGPPRVILPTELFSRLDGDAQTAILAHELAHVRRRDYLVRLLELAATTLFWWHPIVWWACSQLRELEEQCCDSRVLELVPHQARTYANALVETLEYLSAQPRVAIPLPTAVYSNGSLTRRIRMLAQRQTNRLSALSATAIAALVALPLAIVFAETPPPADVAVEQSAPVIVGRVTDENGAPLAGALVRVAIPATDMRSIDSSSDHQLLETKTDTLGLYRLELPDVKRPTTVSVDAMIPGHRRLVGTLYGGGDPRRVEAKPGEGAEASMTLIPALYFKGVVVDEQGHPIPAVEVAANANTDHSSAGVERTASRPDGAFEIFNYSPEPLNIDGTVTKGAVYFFHPDYVENHIDDVYAVVADQRDKLRIVLATGHQIAGTVLNAAGQPVPDVMVKATSDQRGHRKATKTNARGKFTLRGLVAGPTTIDVHAMALDEKAILPITLDGDQHDLEIKLKAMNLPASPPTVGVLGMKLADTTPELRAAFNLYNEHSALILDPGQDSDRLGIGTLAKGYDFWMVGDERVGSVREFVEQILAEAAKQNAITYSIRVVYNFKSLEMDGSNTQYLRLTKQDVDDLRATLAKLPRD